MENKEIEQDVKIMYLFFSVWSLLTGDKDGAVLSVCKGHDGGSHLTQHNFKGMVLLW